MPTYDYKCSACGIEFEEMQKMSDSHLSTCPQCEQNTLKRKTGAGIGLNFTGNGYYITDYAVKTEAPTPCCPCGKKPNSCS